MRERENERKKKRECVCVREKVAREKYKRNALLSCHASSAFFLSRHILLSNRRVCSDYKLFAINIKVAKLIKLISVI